MCICVYTHNRCIIRNTDCPQSLLHQLLSFKNTSFCSCFVSNSVYFLFYFPWMSPFSSPILHSVFLIWSIGRILFTCPVVHLIYKLEEMLFVFNRLCVHVFFSCWVCFQKYGWVHSDFFTDFQCPPYNFIFWSCLQSPLSHSNWAC